MAVTLSGFPRLVEVSVIPGGAAGTTFVVPGNIMPGDTLLSVRHVSADLVTNADITANATITAGTDSRVTVATTISTGNFLVFTWAKAAGS